MTAVLTTSMPLTAGATAIFSCPCTHVAAITPSSTAVVYLTPGEGR